MRITSANRKWWTLAAVAFSLFMIMLDNTVVNVALPAIQSDLGIDLAELEWVVNAYVLVFAVGLLTGGRLADLFGRRRVFLAGLAVFATTSLLCGLANSGTALIAARAAQGIGAALMLPATLSIISATFPPSERGLAIGIWAGVSAMALAIGPLVGGLLIENGSWRWIFYVNVPIGAIGMAAAVLLVPESRAEGRTHRPDLLGLVTSGAALLALVFGLIEGNRLGWTSPTILATFALSGLAFAFFVVTERRVREPMLDLRLFRDRTFAGANVVGLLIMLAMFGVFFFVSIYMQVIIGYSPVETGATFLPMTVLIVLAAPIAGKISDRVGPRWPMTTGMTLLAIGLALLSQAGATSSFWELLPPLLIAGVGIGITMTPMTAVVLAAVPIDSAGIASAVLNTFRQVGGAIGIALMGAILLGQVGATAPSDPRFAPAFVLGFEDALLLAAMIALCGALISAVLIGVVRQPRAGTATSAVDRGRGIREAS